MGAGLRGLLPSSAQTNLLRAALGTRPLSREEYAGVERSLENLAALPLAERGAAKNLRPLLARSVRSAPNTLPRAMVTSLRTGAAREALRVTSVQQIAGRVLQALSPSGYPFLVLRGLALAETVYPDPVTRHCHDLDLLVSADARDAILGILHTAGFGPAPDDPSRAPGPVRRVHPSGFPIELHTTLFPESYYTLPARDVWDRATTRIVLGVSVLTPTLEDHLVMVLGLASCTAQRRSLRWVTDSWFILAGKTPFDWDRFVTTARDARLCLPLSVMMPYLSDQLGAQIPDRAMDAIRSTAAEALPEARDVALYWARPGGADHGGTAAGWDRLLLFGWRLFPSRGYMAHAYPTRRGPMAWLYLRRLILGLGAAVRARLRVQQPPAVEGSE